MKIKIIREMAAENDKRELLLEVDEELLNVYRAEMREDDFAQDSFNEWLEYLVSNATDGVGWEHGE